MASFVFANWQSLVKFFLAKESCGKGRRRKEQTTRSFVLKGKAKNHLNLDVRCALTTLGTRANRSRE